MLIPFPLLLCSCPDVLHFCLPNCSSPICLDISHSLGVFSFLPSLFSTTPILFSFALSQTTSHHSYKTPHLTSFLHSLIYPVFTRRPGAGGKKGTDKVVLQGQGEKGRRCK